MQIITQSEATASERRLRFSLNAATDGSDITGGAASVSIKYRKPGTEDFVAGTGTVTEGDATDAPGDYYYEATVAEVNAVGVGAFRPVHASAFTFTYPFTVVPYDTLAAPPSASEIADAVAVQATVAAALANMDAAVSATSTFNPLVDTVLLEATTSDAIVAIKAKTDSLTFTKSGEVDANIQSVNGATVTGDGNSTPWDGA